MGHPAVAERLVERASTGHERIPGYAGSPVSAGE